MTEWWPVVEEGAWWMVLAAPAALLCFALVAVVANAALDAQNAGRSFTATTLVRPLLAVPQALMAQPRRMPAPDRLLWRAGVVTVPAAAVLSVLVIPFGNHVVADLSVGVVWFNAMEVLTWAGLWLAGWGPNAAFSLIGGYRFLAQGLAYELPLMFALISASTGAQSLRVTDIVGAQHGLWYAVWMPFAFVVYLAGVLAFSFLGPFAYPAGLDVAGGVLGEASGVDRLLLQAGRWLWLAAGAAMAVPLFLGGGTGPGLSAWAWSLVKTLLVLGLLVWVLRRLPAIRADRYVELAWVVLLPLAIVQALVPALVNLNL
ncbi:NADH-quinone oxidoreductase subunit H [Streptomyces sp. NPDC006349]|uniref:NADH-quinone oxidoreductase subunit H n=1 Tax=Streptomyces sp. NPDC006349 TaxID=3156757 RepID=UPI0033AF7FF8